MKVQSAIVRKTLIALVAGVGLAAAAPSFADTTQNSPPPAGYGPGYYGMGPGMMGGYGPGYHYGERRGYGYGPGMTGGFGYGPGMMGGYGYGPGMMGGYGYGPGMMWGYGRGWGMGPGMMWGGYGMGPGSGAYGYAYGALDLTDAQRQKIEKIQEEAWSSHWEIMNKMHEAISRNWEDAQKKIDAVLTKAQREQLKRGWWGR